MIDSLAAWMEIDKSASAISAAKDRAVWKDMQAPKKKKNSGITIAADGGGRKVFRCDLLVLLKKITIKGNHNVALTQFNILFDQSTTSEQFPDFTDSINFLDEIVNGHRYCRQVLTPKEHKALDYPWSFTYLDCYFNDVYSPYEK